MTRTYDFIVHVVYLFLAIKQVVFGIYIPTNSWVLWQFLAGGYFLNIHLYECPWPPFFLHPPACSGFLWALGRSPPGEVCVLLWFIVAEIFQAVSISLWGIKAGEKKGHRLSLTLWLLGVQHLHTSSGLPLFLTVMFWVFPAFFLFSLPRFLLCLCWLKNKVLTVTPVCV